MSEYLDERRYTNTTRKIKKLESFLAKNDITIRARSGTLTVEVEGVEWALVLHCSNQDACTLPRATKDRWYSLSKTRHHNIQRKEPTSHATETETEARKQQQI